MQHKISHTFLFSWVISMILLIMAQPIFAEVKIIHDAEYYILEAQNGEKWAADDQAVDAKLEAFRLKNGGKPPNILYILIDDIGFGAIKV